MLSLEYLLEDAEELGLPTNKRRAIIREYLQSILLNNIYKNRAGGGLYFMGGTALRFCYRLPRFSEDLDFNARRLSFKRFQTISEDAVKGLDLEGFKVELEHSKRKGMYASQINLPEVMQQYDITDERGIDMMIKLEVNQPSWPLETQAQVLSFYGFNYTATVMAESSLISEKLCAMLNRNRGRDIYDLLFMLKKGFPFDERILRANGLSESPEELVLQHLHGLGKKELNRLAIQIRPFLFKEDDVELVLKAPDYAKKFLERYTK